MIDYKIREKALERIMGPSQTVQDFLIDGEYQGFPLNQPLPENTPAYIVFDMGIIYMGQYDDNGFFECCLEDNISKGLSVNTSNENHMIKHLGENKFNENKKKGDVWQIYCLDQIHFNESYFMVGLSSIKYPNILERFFSNYKNDQNNPKGSLEKAYSNLPWGLNEAKKFTTFSDKPENNAIYQFMKHFPVEIDPNCYWLKDSSQLEKVLDFTETQIINGVNKNIIIDIWEHAKVELPKAFEFNEKYSLGLEYYTKIF